MDLCFCKRPWKLLIATATVALAGLLGPAGMAALYDGADGDPTDQLPAYQPVRSLRGTLSAAGSDTMLELQTLIAEAFRTLYPAVMVEVDGKGSATAPPALLEGTVQVAAMSRTMHSGELEAFELRYGYPPTRFDVARDTLVVWVNHDNPVDGLSLVELDAVFSRTRRCGGVRDLDSWGDVGLTGHWRTAPMSLYGRSSASGTHGYFQRTVLCRGDFKSSVKEQLGSASVVQGIERDLYGIGYSGGGYGTSGVRPVPLVTGANGDAVGPRDPGYPLSRPIHVYVNRGPGSTLDPLTRELVRFMLSRQGQQIALASGFEPIDPATARRQLRLLERPAPRGSP
jgi:phosphate transport system substrate-binding protein